MKAFITKLWLSGKDELEHISLTKVGSQAVAIAGALMACNVLPQYETVLKLIVAIGGSVFTIGFRDALDK